MRSNMSALFRAVPTTLAATAAAMLMSCTSAQTGSSHSSESGAARSAAMAPASSKLGTAWGESRESQVRDVDFVRARSKPDAVDELRYAGGPPFSSYLALKQGPQEVAKGLLSAGLKDDHGRWLPSYAECGPVRRVGVIGKTGQRYEVVLRNESRERIEVVVSVDGLDVLDGRPAGYSKRGYIIGPRNSITIPGWRTSMSSVAAFRFAAVGDSYVAKMHEDTRNAGVIGVAVFRERWSMDRRFAQPPPGDPDPNPFPGERRSARSQG